MFCTYCGTSNPDQSSICLYCGQRIDTVQSQLGAAEATEASVDSAAPQIATRTAARVVIEKHSAESLAKSPVATQAARPVTTEVAPPLQATIQKRPAAAFAAGAVGILLLIALWQWNEGRLSHERRIEAWIREAGAVHSKSVRFTRHVQELRSHPTTTMKEYHDQCAELESPLTDAKSAARNTDLLVAQIIPESQKDPAVLAVLNDMKRASDLDQQVQSDVRQEISLSKTLMHLEPYEQSEFFTMSIHPVQEEEKQLAAEEQQIISQIQDDGRKLPRELSRALLSQY